MREPEKNGFVLSRIEEIKQAHPLWGYRRVWAYLRFVLKIVVNRKRIQRLMKENNLLVTKEFKKAKRGQYPYRSKPRADKPNQFWGIDMFKVMIQGYGWRYVHIVKDWYTKKIPGYSVSDRSKTSDWLDALDSAVNEQFPAGIRESERKPHLISDNGCQPTSEKFMKECSQLGIHQIFTSYNNPKGNADTERVIRTIKEDLIWPREFTSAYEFDRELDRWIYEYNNVYPHSAISYKNPVQFEQEFSEKEDKNLLIFS